MSKAAKAESLEQLHAALADELAVAIKETELKIIEVPDADAENGKRKELVRTRNAAVLSVARQFLKDNNIECAPGHPSASVGNLAATLPFAGAPMDATGDDPALQH